jgi:Homeodomain-like domain
MKTHVAPRRDFHGLEQRRKQAGRLFAAGRLILSEIARRVKVSRQSVSRWYVQWKRAGTSGLHGARPCRANAEVKSRRPSTTGPRAPARCSRPRIRHRFMDVTACGRGNRAADWCEVSPGACVEDLGSHGLESATSCQTSASTR